MKVSSTEIQNNFGKYLVMSVKEDIIITKNGFEIAKLTFIEGRATKSFLEDSIVAERATGSGYGGRKATYEEFLEIAKDSEDRYEYIDGEIYLLSSPKTTHQVVQAELFGIFYMWFQGKKCKPMLAPYDITLKRHPEDKNVVQPDIMVICDLEEKLNDNDYYMGVPSLVIEIISRSSRSKDSIKKLDLYSCCGVKEYWIVNPINREISVFSLDDKDITDNKTYRLAETAESFVFPGLTVELQKIFKSF